MDLIFTGLKMTALAGPSSFATITHTVLPPQKFPTYKRRDESDAVEWERTILTFLAWSPGCTAPVALEGRR